MLDRIPMNVINMPLEILVVANQAFPVSLLPDAALTPVDAAGGSSFTDRYGPRKPGLDQRPSGLVVRVIGRQGPNAG
jgi:hypothetical protein